MAPRRHPRQVADLVRTEEGRSQLHAGFGVRRPELGDGYLDVVDEPWMAVLLWTMRRSFVSVLALASRVWQMLRSTANSDCRPCWMPYLLGLARCNGRLMSSLNSGHKYYSTSAISHSFLMRL